MAMPTQAQLHLPILEILSEKDKVESVKALREALSERFSMTEEELAEKTPGVKANKFADRVGWANSLLKQAGLIQTPTRSYWEITPAGRDFLAAHDGSEISRGQLQKLISQEPSPESVDITPSTDVPTAERINELCQELESILADKLLESVKSLTPSRFELLTLDLLEAMGYGIEPRVGGSSAKGIDVVISEDPLGLEKVYARAKNWQSAVGEPEIRDFAGIMDWKGARKGVLFSTSSFNANAKESAEKLSLSGKLIRLIDGAELAKLMIEYGVGVVVKTTYALKDLDSNYFSDE